MPLPADRVVLPPEVRRFLERLAALPTAHWLAAADAFDAARDGDPMMRLALESLPRVIANASTSPWEATRLPAKPFSNKNVANLYEWSRPSTGLRHYSLERDRPGPGWERASRPLCRVWLIP